MLHYSCCARQPTVLLEPLAYSCRRTASSFRRPLHFAASETGMATPHQSLNMCMREQNAQASRACHGAGPFGVHGIPHRETIPLGFLGAAPNPSMRNARLRTFPPNSPPVKPTDSTEPAGIPLSSVKSALILPCRSHTLHSSHQKAATTPKPLTLCNRYMGFGQSATELAGEQLLRRSQQLPDWWSHWADEPSSSSSKLQDDDICASLACHAYHHVSSACFIWTR